MNTRSQNASKRPGVVELEADEADRALLASEKAAMKKKRELGKKTQKHNALVRLAGFEKTLVDIQQMATTPRPGGGSKLRQTSSHYPISLHRESPELEQDARSRTSASTDNVDALTDDEGPVQKTGRKKKYIRQAILKKMYESETLKGIEEVSVCDLS